MQTGHQCMKMLAIYLDILMLVVVGIDKKFGQKTAMPDMMTFFQIFLCLEEKITDPGIGRVFEQIDELQQTPNGCQICSK